MLYKNSNAYLLFYKRRSNHPLGGKTHTKIEEARLKQPTASASSTTIGVDTQLATPPNEPNHFYTNSGPSKLTSVSGLTSIPATSRSNSRSSPASSPPPLDDPDLPSFEQSQMDNSLPGLSQAMMEFTRGDFQFPNPLSKGSPTSSNEAEPDVDRQKIRWISYERENDADWDSVRNTSDNSSEFDRSIDEDQPRRYSFGNHTEITIDESISVDSSDVL